MVNVVIAPELDMARVVRRGIVTVPEEMATVSCDCIRNQSCKGLVVADLPLSARGLELEMQRMGKRFVERLAVRGYEWLGKMALHGPWPSYEFNKNLADIESAAWKRAEQEGDNSYLLPFVIENNAASPYKDYLLVGSFLHRNVLTEVIVKEEQNG